MGNHYNCIYMYTNLITGKRYVGKAKDFDGRHEQHLKRDEQLIDKKIKEYGIENFKIEILIENVQDNDKLNEYEKFFIKRKRSHISYGTGYNRTWGGDGGDVRSGMTEEQRKEYSRKISESSKGKPSPRKGKPCSEESKQKMSEALKGKPLSEETKRKISEAHKGKPSSYKGKQHSEETKQKMSEAHKGKPSKQQKKIICLETLQIFDNATKAGEWCGVGRTSIIKYLKCHSKSSGKHPITKQPLHWMYLDEYEMLTKEKELKN